MPLYLYYLTLDATLDESAAPAANPVPVITATPPATLTTASLAALGGGALAAVGATKLIGRAFPGIYAITAGYSLYKAYKQTKEEKKSKE